MKRQHPEEEGFLMPAAGPVVAWFFPVRLERVRATSRGLDGNRLDHCRAAHPMVSPPFNLVGRSRGAEPRGKVSV